MFGGTPFLSSLRSVQLQVWSPAEHCSPGIATKLALVACAQKIGIASRVCKINPTCLGCCPHRAFLRLSREKPRFARPRNQTGSASAATRRNLCSLFRAACSAARAGLACAERRVASGIVQDLIPPIVRPVWVVRKSNGVKPAAYRRRNASLRVGLLVRTGCAQ